VTPASSTAQRRGEGVVGFVHGVVDVQADVVATLVPDEPPVVERATESDPVEPLKDTVADADGVAASVCESYIGLEVGSSSSSACDDVRA
jgi:hypothetical protein